MMKNLCIISFLVLFASCEKDEPNALTEKAESNDSPLGLFGGLTNPIFVGQENDIIIYGARIDGISTHMISKGVFRNSLNSLPSPVSAFSVESLSIPVVNNSYHESDIDITNNSTNLNWFGDSISINVVGSAVGSFQHSLYNPELFNVSFNQPTDQIDQSQDLSLTWNADPSNSLGEVYIVLIPREYNANGPTSFPILEVSVPDNGKYTIPSSYYSGLNNGGEAPKTDGFDLIIGRANQSVIDHGNDIETVITVYNFNSFGCFVD